ncbi:hypothetical protein AQF52_8013 [Streptomyces venezuelae]|uniref:hypothetical protein n=1 Tax=Streptomyces gardneri TaxID=66892 RepID=UPI0006BD6DD5|nr:hypothetical protein [Streptomyces gardneri]ALO13594.1 hypothetical protein AQF52_8013 [Streptomyces venezuelae]QPK50186.1 hypothetical protein H4W23_40180 [Streptomyces gardneri]WRK41792.1 hypothetical protein U0M97_40430 [Streptomyces venezuelae]CUM35638.1 Transcriptional regulator, IclR family [Streptomyces venezuelae]
MSRFNEDSGGRPAPDAGAELLTLMNQLAGPPDFWDRPDGDFGAQAHLYQLGTERRQRANSHYRLGSKALSRGELSAAADWLGEAASAGHPGALFRLALVVLKANARWTDDAWFLIEEAARHGHGDAERLLAATADHLPDASAPPRTEDLSFFEELRRLLGIPLNSCKQTSTPLCPAPARAPTPLPRPRPPSRESSRAGWGSSWSPRPCCRRSTGPPHAPTRRRKWSGPG